MSLSSNQKRHLRGLGHHLKPVVMVGQHGLRDAVLAEIQLALDVHELIKVKIVADRDTRAQLADQITTHTGAESIHRIGQMHVLFRRNAEKPKIALPSR
jgi:RNA-binding protein